MPRPSLFRFVALIGGIVATSVLTSLAVPTPHAIPANATPALTGNTTAASPDNLPARIMARDGLVLLSYPVREGVRGNDDNLQIDMGPRGGHGDGTVVRGRWDSDVAMEDGPAWLLCEVKHGEVAGFELAVGPGRRLRARADRELGEVDGGEVAAWLLGLARDRDTAAALDEDDVSTALMAAVIARDGDCGPELLDMLDDRRLDPGIRRDAMMWAVHVAGAKMVERAGAMIDDVDEDLLVRETAIVALAQAADPAALDRLLAIARSRIEPSLRRTALMMLAQHGEDPRVTTLLEEIIMGG